jgi:hypothetical protein
VFDDRGGVLIDSRSTFASIRANRYARLFFLDLTAADIPQLTNWVCFYSVNISQKKGKKGKTRVADARTVDDDENEK